MWVAWRGGGADVCAAVAAGPKAGSEGFARSCSSSAGSGSAAAGRGRWRWGGRLPRWMQGMLPSGGGGGCDRGIDGIGGGGATRALAMVPGGHKQDAADGDGAAAAPLAAPCGARRPSIAGAVSEECDAAMAQLLVDKRMQPFLYVRGMSHRLPLGRLLSKGGAAVAAAAAAAAAAVSQLSSGRQPAEQSSHQLQRGGCRPCYCHDSGIRGRSGRGGRRPGGQRHDEPDGQPDGRLRARWSSAGCWELLVSRRQRRRQRRQPCGLPEDRLRGSDGGGGGGAGERGLC
jgi:hypothetical protein